MPKKRKCDTWDAVKAFKAAVKEADLRQAIDNAQEKGKGERGLEGVKILERIKTPKDFYGTWEMSTSAAAVRSTRISSSRLTQKSSP